MSRLLITIFTAGMALLGAVLFSSPPGEDLLTANINQVQEIPSETPEISNSPLESPPLKKVIIKATPTPIIIYVTVTPSPSPIKTPEPSINPTSTPISTPIAASISPTPAITPVSNHIFYTSSHWRAKYYYCDTDNGWQKLSQKYLKSFNSEVELLKNYERILREPCE